MESKLRISIVGVSPMLQHNGQLADPLNSHAKAMKVVSSKRKKTDDDFAALAKLEFMGGLYLNDAGRVIVPSEVIEKCLVEGAKKSKLGKAALAGMFVSDDPILVYEGPKDAEALWSDGRFRDTRGVKVGQAKVMRTRPKFATWSLTFEVSFLADVLNRQDVIDATTNAGRLVGIGDYRPRYGRFDVVEAVDATQPKGKAA